MMTIDSLPPDLEEFVAQAVASGEYGSAAEVVEHGLRALKERKHRRDALREEIRIGLEQLDRGEGQPLDIDAIKTEIHQRLSRQD